MKRPDLYVYYDVPIADRDACLVAIRAMQRGLASRYAIEPRLMRRAEPGFGRETWMEVYAAVEPGFEASLSEAFDATGLESRLAGPRHLERFVALD